MLTIEEKEARKAYRKKMRDQAKTDARIALERNQKPVEKITIIIEWKKSRIWGMNPHATGNVKYKDGMHAQFFATCSGCGYDKESTVIADIFNQTLKYKLWGLTSEQMGTGKPYGIVDYGSGRHFSGGIGTSCYYEISKFIGGKFESIGHSKTSDIYIYTDEK